MSCSPLLYHREQLTWTSALMSSMESPGQARKTRCASWPLKKSISYGQSVKKLLMGKTCCSWGQADLVRCVWFVWCQWMKRIRIVTRLLWLPKQPCPLLLVCDVLVFLTAVTLHILKLLPSLSSTPPYHPTQVSDFHTKALNLNDFFSPCASLPLAVFRVCMRVILAELWLTAPTLHYGTCSITVALLHNYLAPMCQF